MKHPTKPDESPLNPHADEERPVTLNFTNPPDGAHITIAFGYQQGEAVAALFHAEPRLEGHEGAVRETMVLIPRSVLEIALTQGWSEDTVCECCVVEAVSMAPETGEA